MSSAGNPIGSLPSETTHSQSHERGWKARLKRIRARWTFVRSRGRLVDQGRGNTFSYHDSLLYGCTVEFLGSNNCLEILPGTRAWGVTFRFIGNGHRATFGHHCRLHGGHYILEDSGCRLSLGHSCMVFAPMCVVMEGGEISIGDDCMLSVGCDLRNSDGHSILDASTRARINHAADIRVEEHVWIGAHCQILKGNRLGKRSIVAARSVVTKDVAPGTLVAGTPARVLRENIDWDGRRLSASSATTSS